MQYKIFYRYGETYRGDIDQAPMFGVMGIVVNDKEHGKRRITGGDFYIWSSFDDQWYAVDYAGLVIKMNRKGFYRILFGETVPPDEWDQYCKQMEKDPDFPPRSAWHFLEK